jgi:hypothetical protein
MPASFVARADHSLSVRSAVPVGARTFFRKVVFGAFVESVFENFFCIGYWQEEGN